MSSDSKFQLPPGDYAIVNRVNASDGKRLALTFNGDGKNVTVTPFDSSSVNQQFVLQACSTSSPRATQSSKLHWAQLSMSAPLETTSLVLLKTAPGGASKTETRRPRGAFTSPHRAPR
ncbi:hypothetical protein AG1IA_06445 [Rhizoctonia solani AG-1 IA]|uniref:CCL2-like lectin domain-containing protein n=1 Tax=Thanatephorus cucumeris (strain AG1-IA) TaxID=983506 RepID=L8WMY7_THACA|nr:hypothetical protein AG1IA_06445 [Rhizoctonia solani AG-1 IA]